MIRSRLLPYIAALVLCATGWTAVRAQVQFSFPDTINVVSDIPDLRHAAGIDLDGDDVDEVVGASSYRILRYRPYGLSADPEPVELADTKPFSPGYFSTLHGADLNADGYEDVLGITSRGIVALFNLGGDGLDTVRMLLPLDEWAVGLGSADIDGDGDADITFGVKNYDTVYWLENAAGDGSAWITHVVTDEAVDVTDVITTDLNADGLVDLAVAYASNAAGHHLSWYSNFGGGDFGSEREITTGGVWYPGTLAAGDFDGDGDLDIVSGSRGFTGSNYAFALRWFENTNGLGYFDGPNTIHVSGGPIRAVEAADFDGDGYAEIMTSASWDNATRLTVFSNTAGAGFGDPVTPDHHRLGINSFSIANLNGDTLPDLITTVDSNDALEVYTGTSTLLSAPLHLTSTVGGHVTSSTPNDCNGDGLPDVVVFNNGTRQLGFYPQQAGGDLLGDFQLFDAPVGYATDLHLHDFDGDGLDDLVYRSSSYAISYMPRSGPLSFGPGTYLNTGEVLRLTDWDGDGDLDIMGFGSTNYSYLNYVENTGGGTFADRVEIGFESGGEDYNEAFVYDIDQDGRPDLVYRYDDDFLIWRKHLPQGELGPRRKVIEDNYLYELYGAADLDGDGLTELYVRRSSELEIWEYDVFSTNFTFVTSAYTTLNQAELGDVDGDGDIDLLGTTGGVDEQFIYFENTGTGLDLDNPQLIDSPSHRYGLLFRLVDLGQDADLDLLHYCGGCPAVVLRENTANHFLRITDQALVAYDCSIAQYAVTAVGGEPPYSYAVDGQAFGTDSVVTVPVGTSFSLVVRDAAGTEVSTDPILLPAAPPLLVDGVAQADSLRLNATGGTPPYTYSIDGETFQATPAFDGLPNGNYLATVRDARGCTMTFPFTIQLVSTTETEPGAASPLTAYPNPGDGRFTLTAPAAGAVGRLTITDTRGRVILRRRVPKAGNSWSTPVDLRAYPAGVYRARLVWPDRVWTTALTHL